MVLPQGRKLEEICIWEKACGWLDQGPGIKPWGPKGVVGAGVSRKESSEQPGTGPVGLFLTLQGSELRSLAVLGRDCVGLQGPGETLQHVTISKMFSSVSYTG